MRALILAAGEGRRMGLLTKDIPKCIAITFAGRTLLQIQLETLEAIGISDVSIVRGHGAEKIDVPGLRYYLNTEYARNNVLASLFCAERELTEDLIISYSDIWYEVEILKQLCRSTADIAIAVDVGWREKYKERRHHPISEAEKVSFDPKNRVIKIGKFPDSQEVHGEFIGLAKITARGGEMLRQHYHRVRRLFEGRPFQRAKVFDQAYLTDLFQDMADAGILIHCEVVGSAWREIDTVEDFENAVNTIPEKVAFIYPSVSKKL